MLIDTYTTFSENFNYPLLIMKKNVLIILLLILSLSCNSGDAESKMINIESTLIAKDNLYGNGAEGITEQNMVITNQSTWNDLISKMNSVNNMSDNFSETDIDFAQYKVIAVFDEIKSNGGHSVELELISNTESIIVIITELVPQGIATTVITQPFYIVKIPTSDLPVIFK